MAVGEGLAWDTIAAAATVALLPRPPRPSFSHHGPRRKAAREVFLVTLELAVSQRSCGPTSRRINEGE